ncbi:2-amino-4-hydroxy-6-hydroxymethyldihydropteridine diphosphokinase [Thermodesulfobacteriota bacterium B35]
MYPVCIGLGSNLGDSMELLLEAWVELGRVPGITTRALSRPYRTEPVDMESRHWFINAAGVVETELAPEVLLDRLLAMEARFGRRRVPGDPGHRDRTLDLDLLLYGDLIHNETRLILPHPQMHRRLFVLAPLAELVPGLEIPGLGLTVARALQRLLARPESAVIEQRAWPSSRRRRRCDHTCRSV